MPVRNAMPYLRECLQSIQEQTVTDWELLSVNDHSTDTSASELRAFAQSDPRIRVFDNPGKGIIPALQKAFAESTGALITRMDADDRMPPPKLALLQQALEQQPDRQVATGLVNYFTAGEVGEGYRKYASWLNDLTSRSANFEAIYKECVIPSPAWMMRREDLEHIGGFESEQYPEDYDLCFRMYAAGYQVAGVQEVVHEWRDHATRASRTDEHYKDQWFLDLKCQYWLRLERKPDRPLFLWGAGRKGKVIARWLEAQNQPFHWVCETPTKIGHRIGNQILENTDRLWEVPESQLIVAVASPDGQQEIKQQLAAKKSAKREVYSFW